MIRIVEGVPGSGKSYYGVNYVCSKFAKYDAVYDEFVVSNDVLIITNIEGFRVKHKKIDDLIEKYGGLEGFFNVANFEKMIAHYKCKNIILLIDEAQRYFDSKFYDKDVFYFFQYHRHLGVDVFLFTQKVSTLARHLLPLAEFIITAAPRSLAFGNTFRYRFKDLEGNSLYSRVLTKNQVFFKAYKSFTTDEAEKPKNVITRLILMVVVMSLVVVLGGKAVLAMMKTKYSQPIRPHAVSKPVPAPPVAVVVPPGAIPPTFAPEPPKPKKFSKVSPSKPPLPLPLPVEEKKVPVQKTVQGYGMVVREGIERYWVRFSDSTHMVELESGCRVDEDKNSVVCRDGGGRGRDPDPPKS